MEQGIIEASQLPEGTIQLIQSFLSEKEAARTTLLSKSWYKAWSTRPDLHFSERAIRRATVSSLLEPSFGKFARKTLQRYEELNLNIRSFRLSFDDYSLGRRDLRKRISMAIECTKKAMNRGATHLRIEFPWDDGPIDFVLPCEVLESKSLVRLSLVGTTIDAQEKVSWPVLKFLYLKESNIKGNNLWNFISMCPLIEELEVIGGLMLDADYPWRELVLEPELVVNNFHKLRELRLMHVKIGDSLFSDLSSKFPCIKMLDLNNCTNSEEIQICSNSLEYIAFNQRGGSRMLAKFDVPHIRKFEFISSYLPSVSFKTTSAEWESRIYSSCVVDSSSFDELRELLLGLSSSKIDISFTIDISAKETNEYVSNMAGLPKVEKLRLGIFSWSSSVQSTVLENLIWSCRPNFLTLKHYSSVSPSDVVKLMVIKEESENQNAPATHDHLVEVSAKTYDDTTWTWSLPLPRKTLDAPAIPEWKKQDVYLQLRWAHNF